MGSGLPLESVQYLRDSSKELTLEEVTASTFTTISSNNLGTSNGVYWFKIDQINGDRGILEMRTAHVEDLSLYDSSGKIVGNMDDTRFPSYFLNKRTLSFPLYLKASFPLEAHFPIYISTETEFAKNKNVNLLSIGFFYGTAIALIIATLIFYFIVRNTQFVFFALLIFATILCVFAKDNILFLFGIAPTITVYLEIIGHYLVGIAATGFVVFYVQIRPHQLWIKWSMLTISGLSTLLLITYLITKNFWSFTLVDITSIASIILMWVLLLMIAKGIRRIALVLVYSFNIFFLVNIFVLHVFGLSMISLNEMEIAVIALGNFTLIAILMLLTFNGIQSKGVKMNHKIKHYVQELKELNMYKNVQDANDDYLESLIDQFDLENIEVKVLDSISKGHPSDFTAERYSLSAEKLETITNSLYKKLGLNKNDDLKMMIN